MYKGTLLINGKEIRVFEVEAIDRGVDTYFKGVAEHQIDASSKGGVLKLANESGGNLVIKNCAFSKGGTNFEGMGQE